MHLLQAQQGDITDGTEPVDPGQSPADIVVISANDSELAALAEAHARLGPDAPSLRLARADWLAHPYSIDLYLDATLTRSRLVIARLLGGRAYWSYGLEQCVERLADAGVAFAALPGDDKADDDLAAHSSVDPAHWHALWGYLVEAGPENAANFLRLAGHMLGRGARPADAVPLLRAGVYRPGQGVGDLAALRARWVDGRPVAAIVFYRALLQGAGLAPIDALAQALADQGLNPLPIYVTSLKDPVAAAIVERLFADAPPDVVLNATSFAIAKPQDPGSAGAGGGVGTGAGARTATVLDAPGAPVLQIVLSAMSRDAWETGDRGLSARDIAMNVALPEVDGRVLARAIGFKGELARDDATQCPILGYRPVPDRVAFTARLAAAWAELRATPPAARRVALILANYPNRNGRLANGVGLDTPAACAHVLSALADAGYGVAGAPEDGAGVIADLLAGPTNAADGPGGRQGGVAWPLDAYKTAFAALPQTVQAQVTARWGRPEDDPFVAGAVFRLGVVVYGNAVVAIQPARGYQIDPVATYHAPDLVPPHGYLAVYFWLRRVFGAHAVVHLGKHGNLEWLPGKAVSVSERCFPEVALGPLPHLYPFIVNDPGEGTQAKRRAQAVIVDHLTPPLTRAETYGPLRDLEALVDEYYEAAGLDARRLGHLRDRILDLSESAGLHLDAGFGPDEDADSRLRKLDDYLCELKESQIRDGLHVFGRAPEGRLATDLIAALARLPRGRDAGASASLIRALARDLGLLDETFDPLDCRLGDPWTGPRPHALAEIDAGTWRSHGDTVERLEQLAAALIEGRPAPDAWTHTRAVLDDIDGRLRPAVAASGRAEMAGLLAGLDGRFVAPGPAGAPTRGRPDVLPTGRNFFSVDTRSVPTEAAWALGWKSACRLVERYAQDHGDWPRRLALTAWGTANMRTGGDDIAQALALMGVRPRWDPGSRRVIGFEILPASVLGRPRVDVTLRVSGFFRDAFPAQIDLIDSAARAVMALDEPEADNPAAARFARDRARLAASGAKDPAALAGYRVFGAKPGAYGAGLQALIDERLWRDRADLAQSFLDWGGYAYGDGAEGRPARAQLAERLASVEAVVQNQDNREHDLLDSDDYYQFEGGMAATVEHLSGTAPEVFHSDHSRPERPVIRTLDEEIGRVVRARAANPKWIAGVKRHGYKGGAEMAATVDYLFAFAATTHAVRHHHFDLVCQAYLQDDDTRAFLAETNPDALREMAERFDEAIARGLWHPKANSVPALLDSLKAAAPNQESSNA
ncbi:cobaltochelatase CobN subunit [Rhodothalassium salexigens DSM 2132]|uniref:Cobaltochelatase subunit CobN n=1 Tax=Rhodothalassium salexigens DSM 2132 TaxID=1188247 RepID=A0A4V2SPC1_RHOSA|nr:cobaltochelatase subunit CobN [Rhodothalassium salexigens]MBB4211512.1 cobaltochelatase CobN [Rhodothalassium salexigens DSM 2132]MBK1639749.1 cobaltochelatase subunit CobN [Rhodothalassium salexigens DSM 2132]TCP34556.1 cobaltochelatase CobN subunit [Rhodothalassium salexigens DSM 2132]